MKSRLQRAAFGLVLGVAPLASHASVVNNLFLTIAPGQTDIYTGVLIGSYFAFDINNDGIIQNGEKILLSQGYQGLFTNDITSPGAFHTGAVTPGDTNAIDAPWTFFGNTGSDYLSTPISGSTTAGLNFSGWRAAWYDNASAFDLGSGAWQPLNCSSLGCAGHTFTDGNAEFSWDGVYGDSYTLIYAATVTNASGFEAGFNGVRYFLHLQGTVEPVPLPMAAWLFFSGALGLLGIGRRRHPYKRSSYS